MSKKKFTGAVFSDVHLGHRQTKTEHIVSSLEMMFPDDNTTRSLDIIFMSGDYFDRVLSASSMDYFLICEYTSRLLSLCKRRNIKLRFLEGTPSHDYNQCAIFDVMNESIGADYRYVKTLELEHIEGLDIDVIYIPDEYNHDNEITKQEVIDLMDRNQISMVDYVIMHGMFDHQLPEHVMGNVHDFEFYNSIVRYNVYCGHVHQHSVRGNLIVPGSVDRYTFGDECDKGHIRFEVDGEDVQNTFVINKNAKIYKYVHIDVNSFQTEEMLCEHIYNTAESIVSVDKLPFGSNIRFRLNKSHEISQYVDVVKKKYPGINWDWATKDKSTVDQQLPKIREVVTEDLKTINITKSNIVELTFKEVTSVDEDLLDYSMRLLESFVNG